MFTRSTIFRVDDHRVCTEALDAVTAVMMGPDEMNAAFSLHVNR